MVCNQVSNITIWMGVPFRVEQKEVITYLIFSRCPVQQLVTAKKVGWVMIGRVGFIKTAGYIWSLLILFEYLMHWHLRHLYPKKIVFKVSASLAQMSRETTETSSHWFPPKPPKQMRNGLRDGQHPSPRHMMHALTMIQYLLWRQSIVKFLNRNPALGEHSRSQLARWAQKQPEDVIEYEPPWSSPHRQRSDMVKGIKTSTPSKLLCHCFRTCNSHKDLKLEKFKSCVYSSSRLSFVIETTI